jgi:Rieske Fe-S protein
VGDPSKRAFTYFVLTGGRFVGAAAVRLAVLKFLLSMTATKDVLAMANLEVDLKNIQEGQTVTVKWRGKPVFIRHRWARRGAGVLGWGLEWDCEAGGGGCELGWDGSAPGVGGQTDVLLAVAVAAPSRS